MREPKQARLTPLAMQPPASFASYPAPATLKKRGITVLGPAAVERDFSYSSEPLQDLFPVNWGEPDFNMKKLRPRYDGRTHIIPKGVGKPRRISP